MASKLVNCAGWDRTEAFLNSTPEFADKVMAINYLGQVHVYRAFLPATAEARAGGAVVDIAGDAGRVGGSGETIYAGRPPWTRSPPRCCSSPLPRRVQVGGRPIDLLTCHLKSKPLTFPGGRFSPRDEGERARFGRLRPQPPPGRRQSPCARPRPRCSTGRARGRGGLIDHVLVSPLLSA